MLRILFVIFLLSMAPAQAATLLVFGDSLSAGYGLSQEQGWVSLLSQRLKSEGYDYKVANASISGETTLGGASRFQGALQQHRPQLVILELGANDGLRGQNVDGMRRNLEKMIDAARQRGAQVLLVGMRLPPNYGTAYVEKFQRAFSDVAAAKRVPLVPFMLEGFADQRAMFQNDGLHPTAAAQARILDTVWTGLQPLLRKQQQAVR
jgi:acyl-CoA thioesterase I